MEKTTFHRLIFPTRSKFTKKGIVSAVGLGQSILGVSPIVEADIRMRSTNGSFVRRLCENDRELLQMPKTARFGRALFELNHQISNSRKRAVRNHEESRVFTQPLHIVDVNASRSLSLASSPLRTFLCVLCTTWMHFKLR